MEKNAKPGFSAFDGVVILLIIISAFLAPALVVAITQFTNGNLQIGQLIADLTKYFHDNILFQIEIIANCKLKIDN